MTGFTRRHETLERVEFSLVIVESFTSFEGQFSPPTPTRHNAHSAASSRRWCESGTSCSTIAQVARKKIIVLFQVIAGCIYARQLFNQYHNKQTID
jgi:hypothetical protein